MRIKNIDFVGFESIIMLLFVVSEESKYYYLLHYILNLPTFFIIYEQPSYNELNIAGTESATFEDIKFFKTVTFSSLICC